MTLTKARIASDVSEKCSILMLESIKIVNQVFQIIKETLEKGEKVKITGFGNFATQEKRARRGRNPLTGEEVIISPRRVVKFKPGITLRKKLNKKS